MQRLEQFLEADGEYLSQSSSDSFEPGDQRQELLEQIESIRNESVPVE